MKTSPIASFFDSATSTFLKIYYPTSQRLDNLILDDKRPTNYAIASRRSDDGKNVHTACIQAMKAHPLYKELSAVHWDDEDDDN